MAETILLEIDVDNSKSQLNLETTTKAIEALKKTNKELIADQKKLEKQGKQNGKQFQENAQLIALNKNELSKLNKTRQQSIKALSAEKGSMAALKAQLAQNIAARDNINRSTAKGREEFKRLNKEILKTTQNLSKAEQAGGNYGRSVGNYSKAMKGAIGVAGKLGLVLGAGALFKGLKDSIKLFGIQAQAEANLEEAIGGNIDALKAQASALQENSTFGDEATLAAQAQLATLGLTEEQILRLTPLVLDLSARTGKDLASATKAVTSSLATGSTTLEKYGVELSTTASLSENFEKTIAGLEKSVGGTAKTLSETGTGPLLKFQNKIGDIQEEIGGFLLPVLRFLADNFETIAKILGVTAAAFVLYTIVTQASTIAINIGAKALKIFNAVMSASPIGIFLGILALAAGALFAFGGAAEAAEASIEDFNESTRDSIDLSNERIAQIDKEIKDLKRKGATQEDILKKELDGIDEQISRQKEIIQGAKAIAKERSDALELQKEALSFGVFNVDIIIGTNEEIKRESELTEGVVKSQEKLNELTEARKDLIAAANKEESAGASEIQLDSLKDIVNLTKIRLTTVKEGTVEELKLRQQLLLAQGNLALDNEKLIKTDRLRIVAETQQAILKLNEKFQEELRKKAEAELRKADEAVRAASDRGAKRREAAFTKQLEALKKSLAEQSIEDSKLLINLEISQEEFQSRRTTAIQKALIEEIKIREKFKKGTIDLEKRLADERTRITIKGINDQAAAEIKAAADKEARDIEAAAAEQKRIEERNERIKSALAEIENLTLQGFTLAAESAQIDADNFAKAADKKREALDTQLNLGIISQKEFQKENAKLDAKQEKLERKAFDRKKRADIAATIIDTARAAISAFNAFASIPIVGPILGGIAAAAAVIFGAIQISNISKQQFARGGKVGTAKGSSHAQGGINYYGDDGNVLEVEGGENLYVLNKNASHKINALSALNESTGGVSFGGAPVSFAQQGGRIATNQNTASADSEIRQQQSFREILRLLPPTFVSVEDINSGQSRVAVSEDRSNL